MKMLPYFVNGIVLVAHFVVEGASARNIDNALASIFFVGVL
jgi:hypothetical protein